MLFIFSIDLFRQKTPREQMYNAPDLNKYGIHFNSIFKKHTNRTNDSIALYRYLDVSISLHDFLLFISVSAASRALS